MVRTRTARFVSIPAAVLLALALASSPAVFAQGRGGPGGGQMPPTAVEASKPTVKSLADTFKTVGTLKAGEAVMLKPEVAGRIAAVLFEEGQAVAKGAPLFRIDQTLARADLAEAEANAANSTRELKRAEEMESRKLMAQTDIDTRRMQAKVDAAKLASSRARLDKTEIRAPFAGVVGLRKVSPGAYVEAGADLVDLVQLDPIKLDFSAPEAMGARVRAGQPVQVGVDSFPGEVFAGAVYAVAPQVELATRSIGMRASLPNPGLKLKPGQFAGIALELGRKAEAMVVPEQALWPQGDKQFVYVIKDGKADLKEVKIGQREPGMVEIVSGITPNDLVITAGQQKIGPGANVKAIDPKAKPAAADPKAKPAATAAASH